MAIVDADPKLSLTAASAAESLATSVPGVTSSTELQVIRKIIPDTTIGAGGAASVDLNFAPTSYQYMELSMVGLLKNGAKAHLQADGVDGMQERWRDDGGTVKTTRSSRLWLSQGGTPILLGTVAVGTSPIGVATNATHAVVANNGANTVSIVNLATRATVGSPLAVGTGPSPVTIAGNYALVGNNGAASVSIIDISNPSSPSVVSTPDVQTNPQAIDAKGTVAVVANYGSNSVSVISFANPAAPTVAHVAVGTNPRGVAISGNYAVVANYTGNTINIVDISNPASPVVVGSALAVGTAPRGVAITGNYAVVANFTSNNVSIVDLSNPASPSVAATLTVGTGPLTVAISGNYALVGNYTAKTISVVDISVPASPAVVATYVGTASTQSVAVSGTNAVATTLDGANSVSVLDIATAIGGLIELWKGYQGRINYRMTMLTQTGRVWSLSTGYLPAWATKLTITSMDATGLLEGGTIKVHGANG